jgi:hypothetical protein
MVAEKVKSASLGLKACLAQITEQNIKLEQKKKDRIF